MQIHCVYRSVPTENGAPRPPFYSKDTALRSLLDAVRRCGDALGEVIFVNDGPGMARDRLSVMEANGVVLETPGLGNSGSYRYAMSLLATRAWSDDDLVYFVEDDYLHYEHALTELHAAAGAIASASYFTLYDYPGFHAGAVGRDVFPDHAALERYQRRHRASSWRVGERTWRAVRSTTMTFAARVGVLRNDLWFHFLATGNRVPRDDRIWDLTHSAFRRRLMIATFRDGGFRYGLRTGARGAAAVLAGRIGGPSDAQLLLAPTPSLSTHLHLPFLALGVDWEAVARG